MFDMDVSGVFDFVDIRELLESENILAKYKGYSLLAAAILDRTLSEKEDKEHREVLYDCFYKHGDIPLELLLETLPVLLGRTITTREEILKEFTLRVDKIDKIQRVFPAVLNACIPSFSNFILAASKINPEELTTMFVGEELQAEHYRYILVLIFAGILNDDQRRRLGNMLGLPGMKELFLKHHPHLYLIEERQRYNPEEYFRDCPAGELENNSLSLLDRIQRLHLMHERPSVFRNPSFGNHILYSPFLFQMLQYLPHLCRAIDEPKFLHQKAIINQQIAACQQEFTFLSPDFGRTNMTMDIFLSHIVARGLVADFYKFIEFCPESLKMFRKPHLLPVITTLIPHAAWNAHLQANIVNWIVRLLKEIPEHSDPIALFLIGVFSFPYFELDHFLIMDTITEIASKKNTITTVIKFIRLYTKTNQFKYKALECLTKIVSKYPFSVQKCAESIYFGADKDDEILFQSNMDLAKACCLATDDNDEYVERISGCLKENGFRLAIAIDAIYDLVKEDVLDVMQTRKQLQKKVKFLGNEVAFASYCRLLSLGSVQQDDETEEDFHHRKKTLIQEIYEHTKHHNHSVASAAWKALGSYSLEDITEALKISLSSLGGEFTSLRLEQYDGFVDLLKLLLEQKKESYQRPLYNVSTQTPELPPFLTKIDTYKDNLNTKNAEEAWFWTATLPLSASINQLSAPSNKVNVAIRILKSCLVNVPPADSRDGMLRLMASWRICVRETLNILIESKNNDIMWARDHICQEGRISLTQKAESVDNIMMMLTVLVDLVEEKLRTIEDQKQVNEVAKAQKPWVISIFEFIATRLPKEMKEKREQKVNPIYQVMTQSNKSSLHTAIFCAQLLRRHPSILEFYRKERNYGLAKDEFLVHLNDTSQKPLEKDLVPNRRMLWITTEAYGADELTAAAFEETHREVIDEKTLRAGPKPTTVTENNIEEFFKELAIMPKAEVIEIQQMNRKELDKLWTNGTEEVKRKIYENLADLALFCGSGRKRSVIPTEKLADSSVLKGILLVFEERVNVEPEVLRQLIRALPKHKRTDDRFLPPLDWMKALNRADWRETEGEIRLAIIELACEQGIADVIFHFADVMSLNELLVISDHFGTVVKMMPRKQLIMILQQLAKYSRKYTLEKEKSVKLAKTITDFEKNPVVHEFLKSTLPTLVETARVIDPILKALNDPMEFCGSISNCFDVWLEARNGDKMNMKRIMDILESEDEETHIHSMFAIISLESRRLDTKQKIEKILDLITACRITKSEQGDLLFYFPVFLSIIVSLNDEVDIPICFFSYEKGVIDMLNAAREPFFQPLLKHPLMKKAARHIGSFLRPYIDGEENEMYESWQKRAASEMLCTLLATFGAEALDGLWYADDLFWQSLLPVE
uniref:Signal recognition particle 14 kDa protein n=1 Tax=Caenorhabditis tropicalis TaxID=1561998 RepID=A0A1I7THD5_9PELO